MKPLVLVGQRQLRFLDRLRAMTMLEPCASPSSMTRPPAHAETTAKPRAPNPNVPSRRVMENNIPMKWNRSVTKSIATVDLPRFLVVSSDLLTKVRARSDAAERSRTGSIVSNQQNRELSLASLRVRV